MLIFKPTSPMLFTGSSEGPLTSNPLRILEFCPNIQIITEARINKPAGLQCGYVDCTAFQHLDKLIQISLA